MHYALAIGYRYTRSARKSGLLSFLSAISMAGLVVGISLLVTVLSVMNGFERELRERILGLLPQAAIYRAGGIEAWPELAKTLSAKPGVQGVAPFIQVDALVSHRHQAEPVIFYGMDVEAEKDVSLLTSFVDESTLTSLKQNPNGILLGIEIARRLGLEGRSKVMVIVPGANKGDSAKIRFFDLLGFVESNSQMDQTLALANIEGLRELKQNRQERVDGLRLKFDQLDRAPMLVQAMTYELGSSYYQTNWQRTHGNLYHAIQMSKTMVGLLMSLIVALAAFNIVSTLMLVVTEKRSHIAILQTLGASSFDILLIFLSQGFLIGLGGTALGIGLGCLFVIILQPFVRFIEHIVGGRFLHSDVYPLTEIPAQIHVSDLFVVSMVAIALVFIASLYPAWLASRNQPADVLRYE